MAKGRAGGAAVRAAFGEVAAGLLGGMLPGERPVLVSAPHLQASLQRARASALPEVSLPPAESGGAAATVRVPASVAANLAATLPAAARGGVDLQLVWWGLDYYSEPSWADPSARTSVSNTTSFSVFAAAPHRQPRTPLHAEGAAGAARLLITLTLALALALALARAPARARTRARARARTPARTRTRTQTRARARARARTRTRT